MSLVHAKLMPPPPSASDFIVTVWVRQGGVVRPFKMATDASDEQSAYINVIRHLKLDRDMKSVVDYKIRRRS